MMNNFRAGGERGGGSGGAGGAVDRQDLDHLRKITDIATRQLKKLRKYELEQVCKAAQISSTGLKAALLGSIESFLLTHYTTASTSIGASAQMSAQTLISVTDKISEGYLDVLHKRPTPPYTHHMAAALKQDGSSGGYSAGSSKLGGGGSAAWGAGSRWDQAAADDVVMRSKQDPFVEVTETIAGPTRLEKGAGIQNIAVLTFSLSWQKLQLVESSLGNTPEGRRNHVMLRCYKLNTATSSSSGSSSKEGDHESPPMGHIWPLESICHVNRSFMPLKQRKVFFQGTTRKLKGDCAPVDIGHACLLGHNRVELCSTEPEQYAAIAQMVRLVDIDEVFRNIVSEPHLTKQQASTRVKNSFRGSYEAEAVMGEEEDSDDDLMATATRLSLRCPLGLVPITCPARGRHCKHLQCFDLRTFLNFNKNCAGAGWKCGVCNMLIEPGDLVVDTYLNEVVRTLKEQGKLVDTEEVEIQSDGRWEPTVEEQKPSKNRRDKKKMPPPAGSLQPKEADGVEQRGNMSDNDSLTDGAWRDRADWNSLLMATDESRQNDASGSNEVSGGANGDPQTNGTVGGGGSSTAEPIVLDLSLDSDDDEAIAQPPAAAVSSLQQHANASVTGGGVAGAGGPAETSSSRQFTSSPTPSLGSTDDSGGNSSTSPPVASASCSVATAGASGGGATGGGAPHGSSKASQAHGSGAEANATATTRTAGTPPPSMSATGSPNKNTGATPDGVLMSTPSQMDALRRAKNASEVGVAISSRSAAGSSGGAGGGGSGDLWDANSLVSFTSGQAHPISGGSSGVGGGAAAAAAAPPPTPSTGSNGSGRVAEGRGKSTGWLSASAVSQRQSEMRREEQRFSHQQQQRSHDGLNGTDTSFRSRNSFKDLGGGGGGGGGTGPGGASRRGNEHGAAWGSSGGGAADGAMSWQSEAVGMGGGGSGPAQSLKRPRSNSQSDDYQDGRPRQMPLLDHLSANRHLPRHGRRPGLETAGPLDSDRVARLAIEDDLASNTEPNYHNVFDERGDNNGDGEPHGNRDGGGRGEVDADRRGGGFWEDYSAGGRDVARGHSHSSDVAAGGDGGRQEVMAWDDDILRNLDGLGDPMG